VVGCRRLEDIEMGVIDYKRQKVAKIEMDGRRMETRREALEGSWSWQAQWCARTRVSPYKHEVRNILPSGDGGLDLCCK
jgi:hypothetical protein